MQIFANAAFQTRMKKQNRRGITAAAVAGSSESRDQPR
jgi:hypothetical protein